MEFLMQGFLIQTFILMGIQRQNKHKLIKLYISTYCRPKILRSHLNKSLNKLRDQFYRPRLYLLTNTPIPKSYARKKSAHQNSNRIFYPTLRWKYLTSGFSLNSVLCALTGSCKIFFAMMRKGHADFMNFYKREF